MFTPNTNSFLLVRNKSIKPFSAETNGSVATSPSLVLGSTPYYGLLGVNSAANRKEIFIPNTHSFLLVRNKSIESLFSLATNASVATPSSIAQGDTASSGVEGVKNTLNPTDIFSPNTHSFLLIRNKSNNPFLSVTTDISTVTPPQKTDNQGQANIDDGNKRVFLKAMGVAGLGVAAATLIPNKAHALVLGSTPSSSVVGVKNAANIRINPATEETVGTLLKTTDLTFDTGSLQVKVTSLPAAGNSFSDSGNVAKSGLVDADRHVQVDVLSSVLPSSASTETTLQTISFGGFKFALRLATVGEVDYIGEASIGTASSAASWRIKKVDSTSGIIIQWAGTGVFDQIWDNRVSLSYS